MYALKTNLNRKGIDMELLFCILIGYFIGALNPSFFIGKLNGVDIKKTGSGNAGASNALILFGKLTGAFCAVFDIFKAWFAIFLARRLFADFEYAFVISAVSVILGHIFPFYMKFRGGKGLACLGGMILNYDWRLFFIMLGGAIVVVFITNYICFVPMAASLAFPIIYGIKELDFIGTLLLLIPFVVILIKHSENIRRIMNGTEFRFSYLWNKEKEYERTNHSPDELIKERTSDENCTLVQDTAE